jgi:hypothetical protein
VSVPEIAEHFALQDSSQNIVLGLLEEIVIRQQQEPGCGAAN